jgi:antitoxin MazE
MKAKVVRIGNSRGIRLPKTIIEQCGFHSAVDLHVHNGQLVVTPATRPRTGWDEAFRRMHERGEDQLLDEDGHRTTEWDRTEWRW